MRIIRQEISKSGIEYRIVDDLPIWGGYYSIERKKMYGDCEVWEKVFGCTSDIESVKKEFERLTEEEA